MFNSTTLNFNSPLVYSGLGSVSVQKDTKLRNRLISADLNNDNFSDLALAANDSNFIRISFLILSSKHLLLTMIWFCQILLTWLLQWIWVILIMTDLVI